MMIGDGLGTGWTIKYMLSLNSTRCGETLVIIFSYTLISTLIYLYSVKMKLNKIIRLQLQKMKLHQRLNVENLFNFNEWLVGFTDGDGTFSYTKGKNNYYQFTFKIGQSMYNYRILYFIKKNLGYGSITKDGNNNLQFRIRDTKILKKIIIPIFDNYPLHTSKYYNYILWKKALLNNEYTLNKEIPKNYISPHNNIPTKNWIIGFIEAEGSFYLVKKDLTRIVHGFGISQKLDKHILLLLKSILRIKAQVKINKNGSFSLDTTNNRNIEYIIRYFNSTMKGMKYVEYRIWERSYNNHKGNYKKLLEIRNKIRIMKNKHKLNN